MPVWPGDTPPAREILLDLDQGDPITLSTLRATVHLGAHADAPSHYGVKARTIDCQPLDLYVGRCQVIRPALGGDSLVYPQDMPSDYEGTRILIALGVAPTDERFPTEFPALAPELIDWLADRGARLIGVDAPSVDPFDSKTLPAHGRCLARDVAILEGLDLRAVPAGEYELIALPLRLVGFDASPVRAILRPLPRE
jgi:arylformamidase